MIGFETNKGRPAGRPLCMSVGLTPCVLKYYPGGKPRFLHRQQSYLGRLVKQITTDQRFGDLHRVEGRAFA